VDGALIQHDWCFISGLSGPGIPGETVGNEDRDWSDAADGSDAAREPPEAGGEVRHRLSFEFYQGKEARSSH
jgi:hypothetical protein